MTPRLRLQPEAVGLGMTSQRVRDRLVERLRDGAANGQGIADERVLNVIRMLPRHLFVDEVLASRAYEDTALPIGHGQTISQPWVVARMTEAVLQVAPKTVLEVGTGSGFITACLARLAREVVSLERHADLADAARARVQAQGVSNAQVLNVDAFAWDGTAGFDMICANGAVDEIPPAFLRWLNPGGRMFVVRGRSPAMEAVLLHRDVNGSRAESLFETDLPYLAGAAPVPAFAL